MSGDWLIRLLGEAASILDAGCGPKGSWWWPHKGPGASLVAVDLYFKPEILPPDVRFFQTDLAGFCQSDEFRGHFDLIVADHILEHVPDMEALSRAFNRVLRAGGVVHVGIPDATMFTDRFYHLIHPDGGGHVSKPTLDGLTSLMSKAGFTRVDHRPWPDDWRWLRESYDWRGRGVQYFSQEDLDFIADVFVKELTAEKGYYYGWEVVFRKEAEPAAEPDPMSPPKPDLGSHVAGERAATTWSPEDRQDIQGLLRFYRKARERPLLRRLLKVIARVLRVT